MASPSPRRRSVLKAGNLELDLRACCARLFGHEIRLTPTEFRLLEVLMRNPGVVFRRSELLSRIGCDRLCTKPRIIDVYVARLRERLHVNGTCASPIDSVRGIGYMLRSESVSDMAPRAPEAVCDRDPKRCRLCLLIDSLQDGDLDIAEQFLRLLVHRAHAR